MILTIDADNHLVRFDEHGEILNDTTTYELKEINDTTVTGTNLTKEGDEDRLVIDRLSGRATLSGDMTRYANFLWNEKQQRVGGWDLKPGEKLYSSMYLKCQPTKPML